ncbi:GDSL esterase/lipase [Rhynchospora pubera]|uniref:GDSL esterase/lipase n=1 Tax=Rhynchospora pubera TaxID=906938 RepID=A0AAV8DB65_9POAL|nr:GDSL esterase/lipase [Rhynchospora pubera]
MKSLLLRLFYPLCMYQQRKCIYACIKKIWPSTIVIFITPPPVDDEARVRLLPEDDTSGLPERKNEVAGEFAKACIAVAKDCSSPVIDIWSKMQQMPDWEKSALSDGLHFAALGNKVLFEEVLQELKVLGLSNETLPADAPPVESFL